MAKFLVSMLLFLSLTGVFLSILLIYHNGRKLPSSVFLGLFFLCLSIYVLIAYILLFSNSYFWIHLFYQLVFVIAPLAYLTGPLFYLYFRSVINDKYRLYPTDVVHLIPMILFMVLTARYLYHSGGDNTETFHTILQNQVYHKGQFRLLITTPFPMIYSAMSRPAVAFFYIVLSGVLLLKALIRKDAVMSGAKPGFNKKWLMLLWALFFIATVSHSVQIILANINQSIDIITSVSFIQMISGLGLIGLLISPFFFPGVLYGLPRVPGNADIHETPASKSTNAQSGKSKTESRFENDYITQIRDKAETCMKEFHPFLQPDFNMAQLSVLMHVPVHHLAYYFREEKRQAFNDFRNEWRVEHAKKLIREGKSNNLTLEAIGLLSGFSSRNTFLNAFKKAEGVSPQAFLTQIKEK